MENCDKVPFFRVVNVCSVFLWYREEKSAMTRKISFLIVFFCIILLIGCSSNLTGYIVGIEDNDIYFLDGITQEEYKEYQDKSIQQLLDDNNSLIVLNYDGNEELELGDYVKVKLDGNIMTSYPEQANAKDITIVQE